MNARWRLWLMGAVLLTSVSPGVQAQGGILDWISKLSGPEVTSLGGFLDYCLKKPEGSRWRSCGTRSFMLRGSVAHSLTSASEPEGASEDVHLLQLQPSVIYRTKKLDLELGYGLYRFYGEGYKDFLRHAPVVSVAFKIPTGEASFFLGLKGRYFTEEIGARDFGGFEASRQSGGEVNWGVFVGIQWD